VFRRPELLVAGSVPVLLLAGVLSWHRDVLCTQSGCGTVTASAWTGSPVWAAVLVVALALGGIWVLLPPSRGEVPLAVAALTGVTGVVSAAIVLVSLDALVFNRAGFFGFDLPVTETFPVLAVHPGPGLALGLLGLLLQAAGGWTSVRHRTTLLTAPRRHRTTDPRTTPAHPWPTTAPAAAQPLPAATRPAAQSSPATAPSASEPRPAATPPPAQSWPAAEPSGAQSWPAAASPASEPWPGAEPSGAQSWPAAASPASEPWPGAAPSGAQSWPAASQPWAGGPPAQPERAAAPRFAQPARAETPPTQARDVPAPRADAASGPGGARHAGAAAAEGWEAVAFRQGAPPPRRHRRRAEE
jgi:hypothetical protein